MSGRKTETGQPGEAADFSKGKRDCSVQLTKNLKRGLPQATGEPVSLEQRQPMARRSLDERTAKSERAMGE